AFSWDNYKDDLLSIFNTRGGGMAIYGAVIAAFITLAIYSKVKKQSFFQLGDTGVAGLLIGQIIGRWANFMNRECFGGYTDNLLAMRLPIDAVRSNDISADIASHIVEGTNYIQVHPAYLYESLWNVGVLVILLLYTKHKKFHGEICLLYLGGYGLGRFWVESLRTDQLLIPGTNIAVSMTLGLVLFVFALITEIIIRFRLKKTEKIQSEQQD
ncbi:MAG: prolipoprotein diacylglyceryl transferase, partial [Clostridiales bacterium]|nr:prolipoprotein diacylglyceryl transferase [Clostridiales bacterium]